MATYSITTPDGAKFDVTAPDNASEADVMAYAQANHAKASADAVKAAATAKTQSQAAQYAGAPVADVGVFKKALGGAKHALDDAAMGLKGIFTDLTPEDKALLEQGKSFVDQAGGVAKAGEIAGNVAITAPIATAGGALLGAAGRVLPSVLPRAVAASRALLNPYTQGAVSNAATSALVAPEDKGKAAGLGALGAVAGQGLGDAVGRVAGGLVGNSVTPEARALLDQGVNVPLWKATPNRLVRGTAETAKALPVTRDVIKGQEAAAMRQWNQGLIRDASPRVPVLDDAGSVLRWETQPVRRVGQEGLQDLHQGFENAYDTLYRGRVIPVDEAYQREMQSVIDQTRNYMPGEADAVEGLIRRANDRMAEGVGQSTTQQVTRAAGPLGSGPVSSRINVPAQVQDVTTLGHTGARPDAVKQALNELEGSIASAWRNGNADRAQQLEAARDAIQAMRTRGLPPEVQSEGADLNAAYAKYKTLQRAASSMGAAGEGGIVTPRQMINSIRARDKSPDKSLFARGMAPGQQSAQRAETVLGNELPSVGPGTAEKLLPVMMTLGAASGGLGFAPLAYAGGIAALATQRGQRFLAGGLPGQAFARQYQGTLADALRMYGGAANLND